MQGICMNQLSEEDRFLLEGHIEFFALHSWKTKPEPIPTAANSAPLTDPPRPVIFLGWAFWHQDAARQTDQEQDELMDKAAVQWTQGNLPGADISKVRAATHSEFEAGLIEGLPPLQTGSFTLMFTGEGSAGVDDQQAKSGHARKGLLPNSPILPPTYTAHDCFTNSRFCCVVVPRQVG
eukprot:TRINITY_DN67216_c3_g1_i1.p1 TRINITY_DN67216_c3_g1~~TRINITY_DN67216_c3_g1_i1.p1  ORF type:complete len:179 (-),score=12.98 TRINITY_DN67216_c3_g1_i1:147-683(-)